MKNKQTARSNSFQVNAEKLTDLLNIVHTEHHKLKEENERLKHNYQDAVKQIGILEEENDKLKIHYEECIKSLKQDIKDLLNDDDRELDKLIKEYNELKEEKEQLNFELAGMKCDRDEKEEYGDKLYQENNELKDMINSSREWLKLCENLDGNMPSYELRQLDTRLRPERYIIDKEE